MLGFSAIVNLRPIPYVCTCLVVRLQASADTYHGLADRCSCGFSVLEVMPFEAQRRSSEVQPTTGNASKALSKPNECFFEDSARKAGCLCLGEKSAVVWRSPFPSQPQTGDRSETVDGGKAKACGSAGSP